MNGMTMLMGVEGMSVAGQVGGIVAIGVGVVLWLFGKQIARPSCAACGLVLGGLGAWALSREVADGGLVTPWVIGGAVAGCLLASLLFKVWMGLSCAVLLALVAPAASLAWQGTPPPTPTKPTGELVQTLQEGVIAHREEGVALGHETKDRVVDAYQHHREQVVAWWRAMSPAGRKAVSVAALAGGGGGLVLGLILPYVAASFQTALVGSVLICLAGARLLGAWFTSVQSWLPDGPRAGVITLGLITILGVLIQWTVSARRADK